MPRRPLLPAACLAISLLAYAQVRPTPPIDYAPELWKIGSGDNCIYLLGSIHVGTPDMYPLPKPIEDDFTASRILLLESYSPPGAPDDGGFEDLAQSRGTYPAGDSLWKHIDAGTRRRLNAFLKKNQAFLKEGDFHPGEISRFRPWAVALLVGVTPALSAGMRDDLGIDNHFKDEAEKAGKPVAGIETMRFQIDVLSLFPDDLQAKWLAAALGAKVDTSAIERKMIAERNVHMADVAGQYLKSGGQTFIVIGKAHIGGEDGVVRLLEKRGYPSARIPLRCGVPCVKPPVGGEH